MKAHLLVAASAAALTCVIGGAAWAGDVSGFVTDGEGGARLEGVRLQLEELGRSAVTGRDGTYRFVDVPAGDYTLTLSAIGAADESLAITVTAEDLTQNVPFGAEADPSDRIVVVGQRGSLFNALNQKRAAVSLTDVLSSDAIGQFPDENVSESVRRVTGVLVENDQGEGRFVTIRGLNPELNSTSVNGVRIPAPESDIRGVALDVVDSEVLEGIIINKSLTPDMDGDAIGGSIDIKTTTAFDRGEGLTVSGELGGSYNELTEEVTPKIAGSITNIFMDGKLGVAITGSYREREFATENQEVDGEWVSEDGVLWNEELELRDYIVNRERTNISANFDFRPNEDHEFYFRSLFSEFSDQEFRRRIELKLEDADILSVDQASNTIFFGAGPNDDPEEDPFLIEIDRDSKDRLETQQILSFQTGGESRFDAWTVDYSAAFSHSEEEEPAPGNLDTVTFRLEEEDAGSIGLNTSNPLNPQIVPVAGGIAYTDAGAYDIDAWELVQGVTEDDETALAANIRRDFTFGAADVFFKGGAKARLREKFYDATVDVFEEGDVTLGDFVEGDADYPLALFGPAPSAGAISDFFFANRDGLLEREAEDSFVDSTVDDYVAEEDIFAGYVMGGYTQGSLQIVGGVRLEQTDFSASATQVFAVDEDATSVPDGFTPFDDGEEVGSIPASVEDDYLDVLPSLNVRYELTDDILLRGAVYRALARPSFSAIAPRAEVEDIILDDNGDIVRDDEGNILFEAASGGNPNLKRQIADNFDLGAEWYIGNNGILSAGVFYKDIDDYIAEIVLTDAVVFGLNVEEFETFTNLNDASVTGVELGYQQALDMLPGPFDGLIVGANVTLLDGDAQFGGEGTDFDGRSIDLPKLSDTLANFVIGYDRSPVDVRLSYAYRSEYLDEINGGFDDGLDRFVDEHGQWDLTGRYRVNDNVRIYGELKNLNDEPFLAFTNIDGQKVLLQYEEYGFTANFGVKVRY